ncbi:Hypothetical predicted protein [Pelobates cultripes]|uniref:Uncharacterized protein n=1 Tax=Pelobates cultripes TaxID=61616 RepID=A0AAD1TDN9_PELCU|nr:Hypothetical predicted protein [Pelobates cultripes]
MGVGGAWLDWSRKRSHVCGVPAIPRLKTYNTLHISLQTNPNRVPDTRENTGKRSRKLKTPAAHGNQSIGELFHTRNRLKMAVPPDNPSSSYSEEDLLDAHDPIPEAKQLIAHLHPEKRQRSGYQG